MLCAKPYLQGVMPRKCGQCKNCRINRKRQISNRLMFEGDIYGEASCILTLTYNEYSLPMNDGSRPYRYEAVLPRNGGVSYRDIELWIKRFRKFLEPLKIRTFYCGEYGEDGFRPHYHILVFGVALTPDIMAAAVCTWHYGHVDPGYSSVTGAAAQYVSGYVLKKSSSYVRVAELGLPSEFARGSQGIGRGALPGLIETLKQPHVWEAWAASGDVPKEIMRGGKRWPLDRYFVEKLRKEFGIEEVQHTVAFRSQLEEMFDLQEAALDDQIRNGSEVRSFRQVVTEKFKAKREAQLARQTLLTKRGTL